MELKFAYLALFYFAGSLFLTLANGDDICNDGVTVCYGSDAYCCRSDFGSAQCCYRTIYQLWWFWLIWVFVLLAIFGCSLACWRRRRTQIRYTVMANSQYPTYGTVVHSTSSNTNATAAYGGYSPPAGAAPAYGGNAYAPPPGYYAQPQKPPPYPNA